MKRSILSSLAAAVLALGVATTASAQQRSDGGNQPMLTAEQKAAVRTIIQNRLSSEMQDELASRLAEAAAALSTLTPEQRSAIRNAVSTRVRDYVREGVADRISEALSDRLGQDMTLTISGTLNPEQQTQLGNIIKQRLADEMRARIADRLADVGAAFNALPQAQQTAILAAVRDRLADEIRSRIGDRLAQEVGQKLSDTTVGSGGR